MVSEDNLDFLRERQARYLVATPKKKLKVFEAQLLEQEGWAQVQVGVEVKLVDHPDGTGAEQYILCRSAGRQAKERAMLERQQKRLRAELDKLHQSLGHRTRQGPRRGGAAHWSLAGPFSRR